MTAPTAHTVPTAAPPTADTSPVDQSAAAKPEPEAGAPQARGGRTSLFGESLVIGALVAFVALVLAPVAIGWRPYTVLTGSMRPIIQPGDVVMDRPIGITDAHVGDVVTFSDPTRQGKLVTHRIRSITRGPVETAVETRGDANNASERWTIKTKDRVGKVVYVIPKVGHAANAIRNPAGILLLVVIPVLGIGLITIRRIWTEDEDDGEGEPQDPDLSDADLAEDR